MAEVTHVQVPTNGIELHVACSGPSDGELVVLVHGFPELWYSWRRQLDDLADAGFRVVAPDLRGYGESSHPTDVAAYGTDQVTADLCGLLDHLGAGTAHFVGHDWGALALWDLGKLHPQRASSIYAMSVPYAPPAPVPPTERMRAVFADRFFYILYFQPIGPAEAELEADPTGFLRTFFWAAGGEGRSGLPGVLAPSEGTKLLDTLAPAPAVLPAWITEDDVEVYAAAFRAGGFFGPLSYYRNLDANWARTSTVPESTLSMPTGFLTGSLDPVKSMYRNVDETMAAALGDFRGTTEVEGAGHWVQQERPDEVSAALIGFLTSLR
jgi:pimeloyl-ACP methyl ester carboxylesterase